MIRALPHVLAGGLAAIVAGHPLSLAAGDQSSSEQAFVGTTLCGREVREFIGGLPFDAQCHAITWRLTLRTSSPTPTWTLAATYGLPARTNPNAMVEGPTITLQGTARTVTTAPSALGATRHQLARAGVRRSLSLAEIHGDLLHLLDDDGRLMVGNGGWSYTLNRVERAETPGEVSRAADMSYTISPLANGSTVFGVFEGRTPCRGISHQMKLPEMEGCLKVKWRVTLYQNPATAAATTYKIESSFHRQRAREGTWRILRRSSAGTESIILELDATPTEGAIRVLKGDDNVLFFVDEQFKPLIGTADFSYTLNRVPAR